MKKIFPFLTGLVLLSIVPAFGQANDYEIKATFANPETCHYKTRGIFIVWWDKNQ
jgi:hypothetical protein